MINILRTNFNDNYKMVTLCIACNRLLGTYNTSKDKDCCNSCYYNPTTIKVLNKL